MIRCGPSSAVTPPSNQTKVFLLKPADDSKRAGASSHFTMDILRIHRCSSSSKVVALSWWKCKFISPVGPFAQLACNAGRCRRAWFQVNWITVFREVRFCLPLLWVKITECRDYWGRVASWTHAGHAEHWMREGKRVIVPSFRCSRDV